MVKKSKWHVWRSDMCGTLRGSLRTSLALICTDLTGIGVSAVGVVTIPKPRIAAVVTIRSIALIAADVRVHLWDRRSSWYSHTTRAVPNRPRAPWPWPPVRVARRVPNATRRTLLVVLVHLVDAARLGPEHSTAVAMEIATETPETPQLPSKVDDLALPRGGAWSVHVDAAHAPARCAKNRSVHRITSVHDAANQVVG